MRSTRPKPLHLLCGRPMVLYVLERAERLRHRSHGRGRRPRRRAGHQEAAGRRAADARARVRRAARAAGHRRRRQRRPHRLPRRRRRRRRRRRWCCPATRRCCGPRPSPPWSRAPRGGRRRRHRARRPASTTRPATAASCAARTAASPRIVEQRDATADERAIDEINTSIYCFRREPARPRPCAASAPRTPRASTTSPTSSRCCTTPGYPVGVGRRRPTPSRPRASTTGRSWPLAEAELRAPHQRRAGCAPGVTMVDPAQHLHRRHRRARARRHPVPGHDAAGRARSSAPAPRSGPTPGWSTAWSAPAPSSSTPSAATPRSATARVVGPYAVLEPGAAVAPGTGTGPFYTAPRRRATGYVGSRRSMELVTKKRLRALLRARAPGAGRGDRRAPRRRARRRRTCRTFANGEMHCRFGEIDPRRRRLHHPDATTAATAGRSTTRSWSS